MRVSPSATAALPDVPCAEHTPGHPATHYCPRRARRVAQPAVSPAADYRNDDCQEYLSPARASADTGEGAVPEAALLTLIQIVEPTA